MNTTTYDTADCAFARSSARAEVLVSRTRTVPGWPGRAQGTPFRSTRVGTRATFLEGETQMLEMLAAVVVFLLMATHLSTAPLVPIRNIYTPVYVSHHFARNAPTRGPPADDYRTQDSVSFGTPPVPPNGTPPATSEGMDEPQKIPKMLLPLAFVREVVALLEQLGETADHDAARGCCPIHKLHEAIAFRVRLRVLVDGWRDEAEAKEARWSRGERASAFVSTRGVRLPVRQADGTYAQPDEPDTESRPTCPTSGAARVTLARAARRGKKGGSR